MDYADATFLLSEALSEAAAQAESNGLSLREVIEEVGQFLDDLKAEAA